MHISNKFFIICIFLLMSCSPLAKLTQDIIEQFDLLLSLNKRLRNELTPD